MDNQYMKLRTGMEVFLIPREPCPKSYKEENKDLKIISLIHGGYIEFTDGQNARIDLGDRLFVEYNL